jgi:general stress protein 26
MTRAELITLIRSYRLAVVSTVADDGAPQAAVVGFAVTDDLEIVFDTLASTHKFHNLKRDPRIVEAIMYFRGFSAALSAIDDPT